MTAAQHQKWQSAVRRWRVGRDGSGARSCRLGGTILLLPVEYSVASTPKMEGRLWGGLESDHRSLIFHEKRAIIT